MGEHGTSGFIREMSSLIRHRGPDDYGELIDSRIGIFCNRLSIIDLEGGHQPISNESQDLFVVLNGEIYNFPELKEVLEKEGHRFSTRSDTEVIVHGFEQYGTDIFQMLNGMFAIALWDRKSKRLLLARDRVGIKPLFYTKARNGDFVFCSEVKGILAHPEVIPEVNKEALYYLISLYYVPFEYTLFAGISKLPPGHYYDSSTGLTYSFWAPPGESNNPPPNAETVRNALEQSVKRQLISDVEVGSFLSGGLDTSTITAFASKHYPSRLKTFCMGFGHDDDELADAKMVAEYFGTDHHEFTITDRNSLDSYTNMIWHSELPKVNTYSWFVNEYASRFVTVCLSGLGGDEIFYGYPTSSRFVAFQRAQRVMKMPGASILGAFASGKAKKVLSNVKNRPYSYLATISPVFGREDEQVFSFDIHSVRNRLVDRMKDEFFQDQNSDFVQQAVNAEFRTKLPDDFLSIDDTMSMAHSLENRVPLLDNQLLELMLPVSYRHNYADGTGKMLLRKAMKGILPEPCFSKPKQGFSLDIRKWWNGEFGEEVRATIETSRPIREFFNVEALKTIEPRAAESYSAASLLYHVYGFHVWYGLFIEKGKENVRTKANQAKALA